MEQFFQTSSLALDCLAALLGLSVGSFLNVLALRSLAEKSVFWPPSQCTSCRHNLKPFDLVPVLSYYWLSGKCRYCRAPISWQYPAVELFTAVSFVVILRVWGWDAQGLAMLVFMSTLIAVCVTDFREKLIPHEITYPSMLMGIIYSCTLCNDPFKTLAGIGISYVLFDFLAFYGLKFYIHFYGDPTEAEVDAEGHALIEEVDDEIDSTLGIAGPKSKGEIEEDFEVMGGGDAVLAAVIAAWLGLESLVVALFSGFMVGTVMGAFYLVNELRKQGLLGKCVKPAILGSLGCAVIFCSLLAFIAVIGGGPSTIGTMPWAMAIGASILCGGLFGVARTGARASKPFPFGPALAVGAVIAMFYNRFYAAIPHQPLQ